MRQSYWELWIIVSLLATFGIPLLLTLDPLNLFQRWYWIYSGLTVISLIGACIYGTRSGEHKKDLENLNRHSWW